jgi:hypothetical protein
MDALKKGEPPGKFIGILQISSISWINSPQALIGGDKVGTGVRSDVPRSKVHFVTN